MTMHSSRPARATVRVGDTSLRVPRAFRVPHNYLPADRYLDAIGLAGHPEGQERLITWVRQGALTVAGYAGQLYVAAPSYRRPPPGYLSVRAFAAARRRSRARIYQLIAEGRLRPVWRQRVRRWTHTFVPIWAEVDGDALSDDTPGDDASGDDTEIIRV